MAGGESQVYAAYLKAEEAKATKATAAATAATDKEATPVEGSKALEMSKEALSLESKNRPIGVEAPVHKPWGRIQENPSDVKAGADGLVAEMREAGPKLLQMYENRDQDSALDWVLAEGHGNASVRINTLRAHLLASEVSDVCAWVDQMAGDLEYVVKDQ